MHTLLVEKETQIEQAADLLLHLRTDYNRSQLIQQIKQQQTKGYQLAITYDALNAVCVAGFVISEKLAWKKHLYVDDLVSEPTHRSKGAGAAMIQWLKDYASAQGCQQLHLDSGVVKFAAHKFYLREGFRIASHHFSIIEL